MNTRSRSWLCAVLLMVGRVAVPGLAAPTPMPKEDVVEVPAIGPDLCVANVFQSNMVLQRDKPLSIWGWAQPGENVVVSFADRQAQATAAADRSWQVTLPATPANATPQVLTVKGRTSTLTMENVLVGDVWVLGGQSNMEFPISKVDDGELEIASAHLPGIRLLSMPAGKGFDSVRSFERLHEWSDWSGRHFRKGDWDICSPETVREFSAIGYIFGRRIHMASRIPIGLIDTSIGGTTVETWTPEDVLQKIDGAETQALLKGWADRIAAFDPKADLASRVKAYENRIKSLQAKGEKIPADSKPPADPRPGPVADRNRPGHCYAGVIKPLRDLAVSGAVFHQGFNNCFSGSAGARMYYQVFGKMIASWRGNFGDPRMPFCIISLCTAGDPQTPDHFLPPMFDTGSYIREAQYRTFLDLRKAGDTSAGFVSSFDLRKSFYHPQVKIPLGERAATWALASRYGILGGRDADTCWLPPAVEKMEIAGGEIRLTLNTEVKTRDDSDGRMLGFALAGKDRRFYPADVDWLATGEKDNRNRAQKNKYILVLKSRFVPEPAHYRYAWARNPMGNIVSALRVSLPAQRSDDWILEETPFTLPLPKEMTREAALSAQAAHARKELERDDLERRVQEAEAAVAELKPLLEKATAEVEKRRADAEKKAAASGP